MSCHSVDVVGGGVPVVVVVVEEDVVDAVVVILSVVFSVDENLVAVDDGSVVVKAIVKDANNDSVTILLATNGFSCIGTSEVCRPRGKRNRNLSSSSPQMQIFSRKDAEALLSPRNLTPKGCGRASCAG
ncbi:hypothetical protein AVEN_275622-1 [Araneus ventricosus]|uniref:Uncharacterized protein n=1 Tax=Araneus ventricosus TaxID=182803 RepID=A0A4Y2K9I5_ARAVE|nr:hypothetical protein AVEN_275622-1 [Araneus ventricosus]